MRPEVSLYSFTTHFHNIWRLCDCISPSLCHIWKSPHINKTQKNKKKQESSFFIPPPSIGENKRCFKSAFYSPSRMLDLWRKQWRVRAAARRDTRWGISESLQEAGALPLSCRASASPVLFLFSLSLSPRPNIYQVMHEKPWRDQQDRVCVFTGGPYLPDQTKTTPPCLQCPPLRRGYKSHLYSDHATV